MARIHIGIEQKHIVVGLHGAEFSYPFGRLPILHLAIVQAGRYQQIGVIFLFYLILWRVGKHILILFFNVWVAPLAPLKRSKRNRFVHHRGNNIYKRHGCYYAFI